MTVYDAKGGNHGHGAVAAALSTGTTATGTFTVIPSPVPKLGLLGTTLSGASPRRFSHAGTEIVDSYARQASAFQPGNVAVSPVSPVATQRVRPQELGPHVDFLTQTSSCKETKNENAPMWGAWAPNTRSKPALIRHNSRMSTSEIHTHELGQLPSSLTSLTCPFD